MLNGNSARNALPQYTSANVLGASGRHAVPQYGARSAAGQSGVQYDPMTKMPIDPNAPDPNAALTGGQPSANPAIPNPLDNNPLAMAYGMGGARQPAGLSASPYSSRFYRGPGY